MSGYDRETILNCVADLDLSIQREEDDEIYAACPMHFKNLGKFDRDASWSINADTGYHNCFSCGYKGGLLRLVVDVMQFKSAFGLEDWDRAKDWVSERKVISIERVRSKIEAAKSAGTREVTRIIPMTEARLAVFDAPPQWALDARNLTAEACETYGVLWDEDMDGWITPIRDFRGALQGWQTKSQTTRFFRNRPYNVKKSKHLFGYHLYRQGDLIVVESPLDAVRLQSIGIGHAVSTYGARVSEAQMSMLRRADRLIVAMDNDKAGLKSAKEILKATHSMHFECWFINYEHTRAKDVGDMTDSEIAQAFESMRHSVRGLKAIA